MTLAQALYDFGYFEPIRKDGAFEFLATNLPFYLVHSFISIATCFIVLYYVHKANWGFKSSMLILFSVGLIAVFYAESRLYFQYDGADGHDFIALLVGVNEIAALLALGSAALVTRRLILPPPWGQTPQHRLCQA
jgi:hypothetical protein